MTHYRDRYDDIYNSLSRAELQRGSRGFDDLVAGPDLFEADTSLWLGFYTEEGLDLALEKYGFYRDLARQGFDDVRIETNTSDPNKHLLRLWSADDEIGDPLVELVVRRDYLHPHSELADRVTTSRIAVLTVDWLLLQNPTAQFDAARPPLPGQRFPGLGVGAQVLELLRNACRRLGLAGLANVPSFFHNAFFYSQEFRHFDPRWQGIFLALCRNLLPGSRMSIAAASWAVHWELVRRHADDRPTPWFHELMLYALDDKLRAYFDDSPYRREVQKALKNHRFEVDESELSQQLRERGIEPFDPTKIELWIGDQ